MSLVHFGAPEWTMVAAISAQATSVAYLHQPRVKAAICSLPIPFTTASLSLGRPVTVHNLLALTLLYLFAVTVRWLHTRWRVPIVLAIVLSAGEYVALGAFLNQAVPDSGPLFWMTAIATITVGFWLLARMPHRAETGYRSPLPVYLKVPILSGVIALMVLLKGLLGGFMTLFPIISSVGSYEARHSLWTLVRQFPVTMITITPMLIACRLCQSHLPLGWTLAVGWLAFAAAFVPLTRADWASACVADCPAEA
ncbi:MAG: hypothetical protein HZB16_13905 [Armatimonadetes bacterium]|nr:hypothetical protein [Armatimonadota bacterium]